MVGRAGNRTKIGRAPSFGSRTTSRSRRIEQQVQLSTNRNTLSRLYCTAHPKSQRFVNPVYLHETSGVAKYCSNTLPLRQEPSTSIEDHHGLQEP